MAFSEETYDSLVDTIYGLIFGEATWDVFLGRLNAIIPGGRTTLVYHDLGRGQGASQVSHGFTEDWLSSYAQHFAKVDPWVPAISGVAPLQGFIAEDLLPRATFRKTEFYNDFWKPCGETGVGVTILKGENTLFTMATAVSRGEPEENRRFATLLTRLAPHLCRAVGHFEAGKGPRTVDQIGGRLFDAIGIGVLLVGEGGKLISATELGAKALEEGACVRFGFRGRVCIADADADACLNRLLSRWHDGVRQRVVKVNGTKLTMIAVQTGERPLFFEAPTVAIVIETPSKAAAAGLPHLAGKFGLTKAETNIMHGLLDGSSITDIADASNRSRETIRTQLKSIFAKTGVKSQSELFRLVYLSEEPRRYT